MVKLAWGTGLSRLHHYRAADQSLSEVARGYPSGAANDSPVGHATGTPSGRMPDNLSMDHTQVGLDFWLKPMIATLLLSDGYDSTALREVAGLSWHDDPRDVHSAFQQALTELDTWFPDRITAYVHVGRSVASAILSGEARVDTCSRRICELIEFDEVIFHALPPTLEGKHSALCRCVISYCVA